MFQSKTVWIQCKCYSACALVVFETLIICIWERNVRQQSS